MDHTDLFSQVLRATAGIFGSHPHQVELDETSSIPVATIIYQDFLTPATLHHTLVSVYNLPVEWNLERTMSHTLCHHLMDELFHHPEVMADHPEYGSNIRRYLFDRFATTDF